MGYHLNRLDERVFMEVPKPMQTDLGIHHRLVVGMIQNQMKQIITSLHNFADQEIHNWPTDHASIDCRHCEDRPVGRRVLLRLPVALCRGFHSLHDDRLSRVHSSTL